MSLTEQKIKSLNLVLPEFNNPAGSYVSHKKNGNLVFISGQTTRVGGIVKIAGKVGDQLTLEEGKEAARICILNMLCQAKNACNGNLDKVKSVVKITVFVQSLDNFRDHAKISDAASDLLFAIFGEKGKHTRTTIGCNSLPSNSAVEIEGIFEVE